MTLSTPATGLIMWAAGCSRLVHCIRMMQGKPLTKRLSTQRR